MNLKLYEAIVRAYDEEMARDPMVITMGEDIGLAGGTYKATQGLMEKYGADRVIDTPISENSFAGIGIGASYVGLRPVVEFMSINFAWLAMDQIANSAAKIRYMSGGQLSAPVVFRSPGGVANQLGAQHSARMEKVLAGVAGLRVVTPSSPSLAYGLLKSAIRSDDPVFIYEHEHMYNLTGELSDEEFCTPLEGSNLVKTGADLTIFGYNISTVWAEEAAGILKQHDVDAEVIDLYCLSPLDRAGICRSVAKTHRAIVVEEAEAPVGIGAEVIAILNEGAFFELDAAPVRVSAKNLPVPYNKGLENDVIPGVDQVVEAALALLS